MPTQARCPECGWKERFQKYQWAKKAAKDHECNSETLVRDVPE